MLKVNIGIENRLIKSQKGIIRHIEFAQCSVHKVCLKFSDEQSGSKAMKSSSLGRQNYEEKKKCEAKSSVKKGSSSPSIKCSERPLILSWTSTVHKVRGLSSEQVLIDFDLRL